MVEILDGPQQGLACPGDQKRAAFFAPHQPGVNLEYRTHRKRLTGFVRTLDEPIGGDRRSGEGPDPDALLFFVQDGADENVTENRAGGLLLRAGRIFGGSFVE